MAFSSQQLFMVERFLHLKRVARSGWTRHPIPESEIESVADHSFSMALLAWLFCPPELDRSRVLEMALVHDVPEIITGDLTPSQVTSQEEKNRSELLALDELAGSLERGSCLKELVREYQQQETAEARWVKSLDKLEMALQSRVYEARHGVDLQEFRDSAEPYLERIAMEWINREKIDPV